jgi:hypothetical protein
MIRTAKSKSLPVTARPRAQEFTTRIVSTCACAEKKSPANSATSRWSSVGNLSGEIINCVVRPRRSGSTARGVFSRPTRHKISDREPTATGQAAKAWMANPGKGTRRLARGSLHRLVERVRYAQALRGRWWWHRQSRACGIGAETERRLKMNEGIHNRESRVRPSRKASPRRPSLARVTLPSSLGLSRHAISLNWLMQKR